MKFVVRNNRSVLRFIPYIGNKSGFAHIFDTLIPDKFSDLKFYDVFGGGGAFTFYACKRFGSKNVVYNEKNPVITNLIKHFQKNPSKLFLEYEKHRVKSSSDYYYEIRDKDQTNDMLSAGRFLYLAKNAFSGKIRFNPKGKFNCPIRKGSTCPKIDKEQFLELSMLIKNLTISENDYTTFSDTKNGFLYLDPPYMYNPNWHYSGLIDPDEFIDFVNKIKKSNKVMISEQNSPETLKLTKAFSVHDIFLKRSLQYFTQDKSQEIIAINYVVPKSHINNFSSKSIL